MVKKKHIIFVLLFCNAFAFAQKSNWGFNFGITSALGTKFNRIGIFAQTFYCYEFAQVNAGVKALYSFKNLGPKAKYIELQTTSGFLLSFGKTKADSNYFFSPIANQTHKKNSFAYSYNIYFNKIKTTQTTGTLAFEINNFSIVTENDIFSRGYYDRFRTGALLLQYRYNNISFGINNLLWTGANGKRVDDANYPSRFGYIDLSNSQYGNLSHGILGLQFQYVPTKNYYTYGNQTIQFNAGVDAEQIRNVVQNKIIHDMYFLPKAWQKTKNAHIPMISEDGNAYLFKENQKIKKPSLYLNGALNPSLFY